MTERRFDEAGVAAAWDANAERWAHDVRAGFDVYREHYTLPAFMNFLPSLAGLDAIDLGCGEGSVTRRFAALGARVTGVDLSPRMIAQARATERREPLGIRYAVGSFSRLTAFDAASFDCALSTMALMDGPDFTAAMHEVSRIVRPGGFLCFSVLHPCFITRGLEWLRGDDGTYAGLRVAGYFDPSPFVAHWKFSKQPDPQAVAPFAIPRFPRTLADYINPICEAGLRIVRIEEPRPAPEAPAATTYGWLDRWCAHAPLVLFVAAARP